MYGFPIAEQGHIVPVLAPIDMTGGKTGARFHLKGAGHASIIFQIGVSAAAPGAVTLKSWTLQTGGSSTTLPFTYYASETTGGDIVTTKNVVSNAGFTPVATDNIFYVIEVDARELPDGQPYLELNLANTSNSVIASAVAILSGLRNQSSPSDTVIT